MPFQKSINKYIAILILGLFLLPMFTSAQSIEDLQNKIDSQQEKVRELDKQINQQRELLLKTTGEKKGVEGAIAELEASRKTLQTSINQTQAEISKSELTIEKISLEIDDKKEKINAGHDILASTIRRINEMNNVSLIEVLLSNSKTSKFWDQIAQLESFNKEVKRSVDQLYDLNEQLAGKKNEEEDEIKELELQKDELAGEHEAVESTKAEKNKILKEVANKEKTYQQILNEKIQQKKAFEDEIFAIESQIQILIDKNLYPEADTGIIGFPVPEPVMITQHFGATAFAQNSRIYKSGSHPGTDFRAQIGTPIFSVADGVIEDTGNTDAFPGCRAWGKWILVKHNNGLTSLYAHLSSTIVKKGQTVTRGQTIGNAGATGIVTGPHLHFTLYASQGVYVGPYTGTSGCALSGAYGPFADLDAYLDPEAYIPKNYTVAPGA